MAQWMGTESEWDEDSLLDEVGHWHVSVTRRQEAKAVQPHMHTHWEGDGECNTRRVDTHWTSDNGTRGKEKKKVAIVIAYLPNKPSR